MTLSSRARASVAGRPEIPEQILAISDAMTRISEDAQELLRGPLDDDAPGQVAMLRRSAARQRERFRILAGAPAGSRPDAPNPLIDLCVEVTRARITDALVYLDLAAKAIDQAAGPDPAGSAIGDAAGTDLRPDPANARTAAGLVSVLRDFRVWAGEPSYREMSERNNGKPAASTIYTALSSDELPKLDMVMAIVSGCGGGQEDRERFASAWRAIRTGAATPFGLPAPEQNPLTLAQARLREIFGVGHGSASPDRIAG